MPFSQNPDGTFTITGIDPTGKVDCSNELNGVITSIWNNFGGGKLWLPRPGSYKASTIIMRGSVMLQGHGRQNTSIGDKSANAGVFIFAPDVLYGGMHDLFAVGFYGANPTASVVTVYEGVAVDIRRCHIWGASSAIDMRGTDGTIEDCYLAGWNLAAVYSTGANWWRRCKMDMTGDIPSLPYGFYQGIGVGSSVQENHLEQCDISGNYGASLTVEDGNTGTAVTVLEGCVLSSPIKLTHQKHTSFSACEFGSQTFVVGNGSAAVTGSVMLGPQLTLPPGVAKAGNINII